MMLRTSLGRAALALIAGLALASSALAQTGTIGRAPATGGLPGTYAVGDLLCASSTSALGRLAAPAAGQVLKSNGVGACPSWTNAPVVSSIEAPSGSDLIFKGATTGAAWKVVPNGHFVAQIDNTYDIGASGATRPRTGYFGTSVSVGSTLITSSSVAGMSIVQATQTGYVGWAGRAWLKSPADGSLQVLNNAETQSFTISTGIANLATFNGAVAATNFAASQNIYTGTVGIYGFGDTRTTLKSPANGALQVQDSSQANSFTVSAPLAAASATFQHGALDAASPVAQTIKFQDVVAGTSNTSGVAATIQLPAGTGSGNGGTLAIQYAVQGAPGTAKHTWANALAIGTNGNVTFSQTASFSNDIGLSGGSQMTFGVNGSLRFAAANVFRLNNYNATAGAAFEVREMTAPSAPATDSVRLYAEDNGSGKTRLMALFATGAAQQVAIEP